MSAATPEGQKAQDIAAALGIDVDGAVRILGVAIASEARAGAWEPHVYLSSACRHATDPSRTEQERADLHRKCQHDAMRYDGTHKEPAQCKECGAPCTCACHREAVDGSVR